MTMFGITESEVAQSVRVVAGDDLDRAGILERFARATWTGIAEPGDRIAGVLAVALGAPAALTAVLERWSATRVGAELAAIGHTVVTTEELEQALERWQPRLSSGTAMLALRQAARCGARLLIPGDTVWPGGLAELDLHAPLALWVRGNLEAVAALDRSIALVGARAATGYGEHVTMEASAGLVDRGYSIVSGAAYGIDGMAHRAALASRGQTVAFLAGGVDRFYPSGHEALLTRIVESGAVVSELPCGAPPTKWRFLQRNRLIAAVGLATIVLEAGWRSGSLNTAGHAAALGRPLGAVPGPVTSAASAGCHRLIREFDAVCVTNADEMAELAPLSDATGLPQTAESAQPAESAPPHESAQSPLGHDDSEHTRVLDALSTRSARDASTIAASAGLSVAHVQSALGQLELDGVVREREKGWIKKSPQR